MTRWQVGRALGVATLVFAATVSATAKAATPVATADPVRQILVLLRLPAPHLQAGGDYGGSYGEGAGRSARRRLASALARRHGLDMVDDWPMPLLGVDCFVLAVRDARAASTVAEALAADERVEWAQPVSLFEAQGDARGDPLFLAQPASVEWRLADLHRVADGRGVRVAIIDSQVDRAHPDLEGQVELTENFVAHRPATPEHHGTEVAGIVAAVADNGLGIVGVAPRARLLALRACWEPHDDRDTVGRTVCDSFSLAKAIYFAIGKGAKILNLSLSGPSDPLLARLIDVAQRRNIVVVAAFDESRREGGFPALHPGVVAVSDRSRTAARTVFTAPGRGVPTTQTDGRWTMVDGSSFAAAHVSGLIALMRSRSPAVDGPVVLVTRPSGGAIDSCATLTRANAPNACPGRGGRTSLGN